MDHDTFHRVIIRTIEAHDDDPDEFDLEAIGQDVAAHSERDNLTDLEPSDYWRIIEAHRRR